MLAAFVVPLALTTIHRAWRGRFDRHRRLARVTLPIWLYVSVSGVLVYVLLYLWADSVAALGMTYFVVREGRDRGGETTAVGIPRPIQAAP